MANVVSTRTFPLNPVPRCNRCEQECVRKQTRYKTSRNFGRYYYTCRSSQHGGSSIFRTFDDYQGIEPHHHKCDCGHPTRYTPYKRGRGGFLKCSSGHCGWSVSLDGPPPPPSLVEPSVTIPSPATIPSNQARHRTRTPERPSALVPGYMGKFGATRTQSQKFTPITQSQSPHGFSTDKLPGSSPISPEADSLETPIKGDGSQPETPASSPPTTSDISRKPEFSNPHNVDNSPSPTERQVSTAATDKKGKGRPFQHKAPHSSNNGSSSHVASPSSTPAGPMRMDQGFNGTSRRPATLGRDETDVSNDSSPPSDTNASVIHMHIYIPQNAITGRPNAIVEMIEDIAQSGKGRIEVVHIHQEPCLQLDGNKTTVPKSGLEPVSTSSICEKCQMSTSAGSSEGGGDYPLTSGNREIVTGENSMDTMKLLVKPGGMSYGGDDKRDRAMHMTEVASEETNGNRGLVGWIKAWFCRW